jgi:hypothetical protein
LELRRLDPDLIYASAVRYGVHNLHDASPTRQVVEPPTADAAPARSAAKAKKPAVRKTAASASRTQK